MTSANVTELCSQLLEANSEIERLSKQVTQSESETIRYRKERNDIMDERDELQSSLAQNIASIQRLQSGINVLESKLESAASVNCHVIADLAEMVTNEQSIACKEMQIEKDKERLNNEIRILTEKLKDTSTELSTLRQISASDSVQLKAELKQKAEDLLSADRKICQLTEANQLLAHQNEQNTLRLKEQVEESVKLVGHHQKELDAKIKLADLYKDSTGECQLQLNTQSTLIADLRAQLVESSNKYEVLEGNLNDINAQHQICLEAKDEMITQLKQDLKNLETETVETILERPAPKAAAVNRLLKHNLSLTQIYMHYYDAIDDANSKDNECRQLKLEVERIQLKLNGKTEVIERQKVDIKILTNANGDLTQNLNALIVERDLYEVELKQIRPKFEFLERENAQLKSTLKDLARQICYLSNEIQASGGEMTSGLDQQQSKLYLSNAKKLVTFKNIEEMQENNQKLLLKVRELSTKVEEMEAMQNHINMQCYEAKISSYKDQLQCAEQNSKADKELLEICFKQKERFKQLYYEAVANFDKTPSSDIMEGIEDNITVADDAYISENAPNSNQDNRTSKIEKMLQYKLKELKDLKYDYSEYRTGSSDNFKLLNDQCNELQDKMKELISRNCQLSSQVNLANKKIITQEESFGNYKRKIQTLEQHNQMYDKIIGKYELSNKQLRDEALNAIKKLSSAENQCKYLQEECRRLIGSNSKQESVRQAFRQQNLTYSLLQKDLEMMKVSSERLEFENRLRMELQLDKVTRECSALRQKLKDEENRSRDDTTSLKRQADNATTKMKDEQAQVEILRSKINEQRRQIELKNQQINELSKMLQEALTPYQNDDSISKLMSDLQAPRLNETNLEVQVEELQSKERLQLTGSHLKAAEVSEYGDRALNSHLEVNSKEFLEVTTSFDEASSSNYVTTTKSRKRPRDVEPCSADEESSFASESASPEGLLRVIGPSASPQNKRIWLGERKFHGETAHVLDIEYQLPASSQRDKDDDAMVVKVKDRDEVESFANGEALETNQNIYVSDTNEVEDETVSFDIPGTSSTNRESVHTLDSATESLNHLNQSSISRSRANVSEFIEMSSQTQQNQIVSRNRDADQETLHVACRTDEFCEATTSPHPILALSGDGVQRNITATVSDSDHQEVEEVVVVVLADEGLHENKETNQREQIIEVSGQAEGTVSQIIITEDENACNNFDEKGVSILKVNVGSNDSVEVGANDVEDVGNNGISSEENKLSKQDEIEVEDGGEGVASTDDEQLGIRRSWRNTGRPTSLQNQRSNPTLCDKESNGQRSSEHHASTQRVHGNRKILRRSRL